jgi:hypothetical protein
VSRGQSPFRSRYTGRHWMPRKRVISSALGLSRPVVAVLGLVTLSFATAAAATDLDTEIVFHISAQPLDRALLEFSKQANTPVAFAAKSIGALKTTGLDGKFVARAALSALLCNSGLSFSQIGDTITVIPGSSRDEMKSCAASAGARRSN